MRGSDLPQDNLIKNDTSLDDAVFHSLGRVSGCWSNLEGAGKFLDEEAKKVGQDLINWINSWYVPREPS